MGLRSSHRVTAGFQLQIEGLEAIFAGVRSATPIFALLFLFVRGGWRRLGGLEGPVGHFLNT